jgi:hypothetical protein
MSLLKIEDIAKELNISLAAARSRVFKNNIKKVKSKNRRAYYSSNAIELLMQTDIKYYPLKTTVIYHIYESKMNYEA